MEEKKEKENDDRGYLDVWSAYTFILTDIKVFSTKEEELQLYYRRVHGLFNEEVIYTTFLQQKDDKKQR
uniref:Uncharacterized protein n=1 Tax=Pristionchus pacificus TaxID=54126 RepID=A0A2A6CTE2_PRIPA|eukprot:PDM81419.1 hypothetical protein PRIPAC_35295 [Pristionchus pacificus]